MADPSRVVPGRSGCVGTDIEGFETHGAGSRVLIERIAEHPALETLPVKPDDLAIVSGEWLRTR
jgi:hypothetical protein